MRRRTPVSDATKRVELRPLADPFRRRAANDYQTLKEKAMNVQIQSVKFDAGKQLIEFIEKKLAKLDRFAENAMGADVILKLDKDNERGNKIAVVTLHIPGGDLRVEEQARTFEEAIDNSLDVMKRQIEKAKGRNI